MLRQNDVASESHTGKERGAQDYASQALAGVPLVSLRASAGNGEEPYSPLIDEYIGYSRSALREIGVAASRLLLLSVSGDSMIRTLWPGDRILVSTWDGNDPIHNGGIYVFHRQYQGVLVKRTLWQQDGSLLLRSDNPDYHDVDFAIQPGEAAEWKIIGRVLRVEKNL